MKKFRILFTVFCSAFTLLVAILFFIFADIYGSRSLDSRIKSQYESILFSVQSQVKSFNDEQFATIRIISSMPFIKDSTVPLKAKAEELFGVRAANPNLVGLNITDLKGNSYLVEGGEYNFSERSYFKNALKGEFSVFGPILNKVTDIPTIFYGGPHYDRNGKLSNTFFLAAHAENLVDICKRQHIGKTGYPSLIKRSTGLVIADINPEKTMNANVYDEAWLTGDSQLRELSDKMQNGETGYSVVKGPHDKAIIGYAPIEGTDWSVVVLASYSEFTEWLVRQRIILGITGLGAVIITAVLSFFGGKKLQAYVTKTIAMNS